MSEFEIADIATQQQAIFWQMWSLAESLTDKANVYVERLMTLMFGYLAVAHFAGSKLTRMQALIFTLLYLVWTSGLIMSMREASQDVAVVAAQMQQLNPQLHASIWRNNNITEGSGVAYLLVACIVASLYFMWSTRSKDAS
ncbi:MAG: hypothetical protein AB8C02_00295 [Halioglobus sp.]